MKMRRAFLFICTCWILVLALPAFAGQACNDVVPTPETLRKSFGLALNVREQLDRSGAEVAIVARVGQDLSRYRVRYSHAALVWRDHPAGRWLVVHELNECGTDRSHLYNEGLANFFADDLFAWDALVIYPAPPLQEKLAALLKNGAASLHESRYNMVAYPYSTRYQNSNQWVLEVLADAMARESINGRREAQSWLKRNDYRPATLEVSAMERLGGRLFRANVAFDDHPFDRRMAGHIDAVTVESVDDFVLRHGDQMSRQVISLNP